MKRTETKWNNITNDDINEQFGFVYLIRNKKTSEWYVGKKQMSCVRYLPPLKGYKRRRKKIKATDWKTYKGSSDYILNDIQKLGEDNFEFTIVYFCNSKSELAYIESYLQMYYHVLLDHNCYNRIVKMTLGKNTIIYDDMLQKLDVVHTYINQMP